MSRYVKAGKYDTGYRLLPEIILQQIIKPRTNYYSVNLWCQREVKNVYVHRLVAEAFIPNPKGLNVINHIDCNTYNNKVDNLEWVTRSENTQKAYSNKQQIALGKPKLTPELVKEIRENKHNLNRAQLAKRYNVSCGCIQHIKKGRTWKNI